MALVIDDRYELLGASPLGSGTFGEVWLAADRHLGITVALKLFYPTPMPSLVRRAEVYREAKFLETVRAPNVLPVFNADTDEGRDVPYIAMEYAPNGSAEDQLAVGPRGVSPWAASAWMRGVLVGLQGCHDARILHGDIKPANIFIERFDNALLGDLGVARQMDPAGQARPAGDIRVQPPEAFATGFVDVRSDVYGVAVALFRLLTGEWPFEDPDPTVLARLITTTSAPRVRDLAPHVPRGMALLTERSLSRDAADRPATAQAMRNELARQTAFDRYWQPTLHPGHLRCWEEDQVGAPHVICVTSEPTGEAVTVRRGKGGRVTRLCKDSLSPRDTRIHLRRVFDDLGC